MSASLFQVFKSSTVLFSSGVFVGALIAVSSSSWFGVWLGLELNLLSFIPLAMMSMGKSEVEAGLKYFLVQACGSVVLVYSGVFISNLSQSSVALIFLALALKLGLAPMHFWFPMVSEGLSWGKVFMLSTVQKVAPLTLLYYTSVHVSAIMTGLVVLASGLAGALGGVNETLLRKLFSFSSINHMGWIVLSMWSPGKLWACYFALYSVVFGGVVLLAAKFQVMNIEQIFNKPIPLLGQLSMFISVVSLGGLPPLLGFLPKWMVLQELSGWLGSLLIIVLLILNVITLYYYLRVGMKFTLNKISGLKGVESSLMEAEGVILTMNLFGLVGAGGVWVSLLH